MMNDEPENPPAFPSGGSAYICPGMKLRDYFAIRVQLPKGGIPEWQARKIMGLEPLNPGFVGCYPLGFWQQVEARYRFICADAMLEERMK